MFILILIDVQHSQKAVFGFGKGSKSLFLRFPLPGKKSPPVKLLICPGGFPPHPLPLFGKLWVGAEVGNIEGDLHKTGS